MQNIAKLETLAINKKATSSKTIIGRIGSDFSI